MFLTVLAYFWRPRIKQNSLVVSFWFWVDHFRFLPKFWVTNVTFGLSKLKLCYCTPCHSNEKQLEQAHLTLFALINTAIDRDLAFDLMYQ